MNNQWFSKVAVWLVIGLVLFTVFKQFDGRVVGGANYMAYSDFLEEVRGKRVRSATRKFATASRPASPTAPLTSP